MFMKPDRGSRSVDYALSALSPLAVAQATRAYLDTLSEAQLQELIAHSVPRMDDDERALFEMSPDFRTFLEQNRRALRTLDRRALHAILGPAITEAPATVEGPEGGPQVYSLASTMREAFPKVKKAAGAIALGHHCRGRRARGADLLDRPGRKNGVRVDVASSGRRCPCTARAKRRAPCGRASRRASRGAIEHRRRTTYRGAGDRDPGADAASDRTTNARRNAGRNAEAQGDSDSKHRGRS